MFRFEIKKIVLSEKLPEPYDTEARQWGEDKALNYESIAAAEEAAAVAAA
jgi:hypothetical protein